MAEDDELAHGQAERLDIGRLARMLKERRGSLSIRQAAAEVGVSFSTLSRVEAGAQPDMASYTALCAWLGVSPGLFFMQVVERELSPLEHAVTHLQADPRLTADAAGKISSVLRDLYAALAASAVPPAQAVACHLRATPLMRPGAAPRLASAIRDMHDELERQVEAGSL
jgi:transcriptional regulator with XRE-family HTH domain